MIFSRIAVAGSAPYSLPHVVVGWVPVADSLGYVLLAKGGADAGVKWRYRVVCRAGAFVRHGIELTSAFLFNLPWHSVVEVSLRK